MTLAYQTSVENSAKAGAKIISWLILNEFHEAYILLCHEHTSIWSLFNFTMPLNLSNIQVYQHNNFAQKHQNEIMVCRWKP